MSETSLLSILKKDPILSDRIVEQVKKVKKTREDLKTIATTYNERYKKEIDEGTLKQQLLIEDGRRKGLSEEEAFEKSQKNGFVPTKYTPVLNFLYFLLNEHEDNDAKRELLREEYNREFGHLVHEEMEQQNVPEMETFIYGNMTHEEFKKIKKLKALSRSKNEHEAFLAYTNCLRLCEKYGLEFDKIPA